MKVYELVALNSALLKRMEEAGIKPRDYIYLNLYADYSRRVEAGEKVSYIVLTLAEKYHISERKVYQLEKLFREEVYCNIHAVETPENMEVTQE
ncbi:MAG: hypothetical protein LUD76_10295 [Alistipes sp.]|nr:hypothetical protein [Alistipes sp.]